MKDDTFYTIAHWMRTRLGLKGKEVDIFASIWGFTQDNQGRYNGSITYISELVDASRRYTIGAIDRLEKLGYIEKHRNGVGLANYYTANVDKIDQCRACTGAERAPVLCKPQQKVVHEVHGTSAHDAPNNNINNNINNYKDNNDDNTPPTTQKNNDYKLNFESVDIKILAESMRKEITEGSESVNAMMTNFRYNADKMREELDDFVTLLTMKNETKKTRRDFRHHFINFMTTRKREQYDNEQKRQQRQQYESPAQQNPRLAVPDLGEGNCKLTVEELEEARRIWDEVMEAERKREEQERERRSK